MTHFWLFFGRFHPLAVHLPIGILLVLVVLEGSTALSRHPRFSRLPALGDGPRSLILVCAALAAIVAAGMGWLLAGSGDYDPGLVYRHRCLGLTVAALTLLLLGLHRQRWRRVYAAAIAATLVALVAAGHTGGTLTHGASFLTEYLPAPFARFFAAPAAVPGKGAAQADPRRAPAYAGLIQPILAERCASCHGATKSNGDLRLDTWVLLLKGGKHGAVFKAGDSASSRLLQRIDAPLEEKEHMPPKGKPQLADDDVTLLRWWVDAGAPEQTTLGELAPPPEIASILAVRFGLPGWGGRLSPPDRNATLVTANALASRLGIVIRPLAPDGPWLAVNARMLARRFGDDDLTELAALGPALQWLDLGETAVTDRGLAALAAMKNLRRLDLDRTAVTDAGLARLAPLARLEYLNLFGTAVTDAGLASLRPLLQLRSLYLWQTHVTPAAADALAAELTDRRKLRRWQDQVADLENRIRAETFYYNLGAPVTTASPPAPPLPPKSTPPALAGGSP